MDEEYGDHYCPFLEGRRDYLPCTDDPDLPCQECPDFLQVN